MTPDGAAVPMSPGSNEGQPIMMWEVRAGGAVAQAHRQGWPAAIHRLLHRPARSAAVGRHVRIDPDGPLDTRSYAHRWGQVAKKLERLTGLDQASPDALLQELDAASDWMRLRARAQMADHAYQGLQSDLDWRTAQPRLLGKLPGLAAQLDRAVAAGTTRGHLCVTQSELDTTKTRQGIFYAKARWRKAKPSDNEVRALRNRLANAARAPIDRDQALRRALGDPVALARSSYPSSPERVTAVRTSPSQLASTHGAAAPHRAPHRRR
jgi:hypothetical protein